MFLYVLKLLLRTTSHSKSTHFIRIMAVNIQPQPIFLLLTEFLILLAHHTPEHNGYSERKHRHIVETGLSLLSHALMPLTFWPQSFATAVYLINRMPTPTLNLSSPFEKIFGTPLNYSKLRTFGCLCYPWLRPYSSHKLDVRSKPCVFLGYFLTQCAYLCFHRSTLKICLQAC